MFLYSLCIVVVVVVVNYLIRRFVQRQLPPGPPSLPLIGSLPFLSSWGVSGLLNADLAKKYGKIVSVGMGPITFITLNDYETTKKLFNMDELSGRPTSRFHETIRGDGRVLGVLFNNGFDWRSQRRFSLKTLKNLGMGRKSLESIIQEEALQLFEIMNSQKNDKGDILIDTIFTIPVINVLWRIVASHRFDVNDPEIQEIVSKLNQFFKSGLTIKRILTFLQPYLPYDSTEISIIETRKMLSKLINEHVENLDPRSPADFIDFYLLKMKEEEENGIKTGNSSFHKEQLITLCLDLFQAGAETTSTSLIWSVLLLSIYPDVQSRCAEEIRDVIGSNLPRETDVTRMPYCKATLMEIQRYSCTAPGSVPHLALSDVIFEGYRIPKGSILIHNIINMHYDPNNFTNPDEFRPERFMEAKWGRKDSVNKNFVPFGIGKRICMGESLAKQQLSIFFVMLIQNFCLESSPRYPKPDPQKYVLGMTKIPDPFYLTIRERNL